MSYNYFAKIYNQCSTMIKITDYLRNVCPFQILAYIPDFGDMFLMYFAKSTELIVKTLSRYP